MKLEHSFRAFLFLFEWPSVEPYTKTATLNANSTTLNEFSAYHSWLNLQSKKI